MTPFVLVTGNPDKVVEAERVLGRRVESIDLDLPEIQGLDLVTILRVKGEEAWRRLGRPLAVEETGLGLDALGGFPGPLVRWMLEAVGPAGIARTAHGLGDPGARAHCAVLYRDAAGAVIGEGEELGTLVLPPRGSTGFGWDPVFQPAGQDRTYGELPGEVKDEIGHRGKAWRALLAALEGRSQPVPVPAAPATTRPGEDRR